MLCLLFPMADAVNEKIDFGIITTGSITSPQGIDTYTFPEKRVIV